MANEPWSTNRDERMATKKGEMRYKVFVQGHFNTKLAGARTEQKSFLCTTSFLRTM